MKLSIENFFSKCDQIRGFLQISHIQNKSITENFSFCPVLVNFQLPIYFQLPILWPYWNSSTGTSQKFYLPLYEQQLEKITSTKFDFSI